MFSFLGINTIFSFLKLGDARSLFFVLVITGLAAILEVGTIAVVVEFVDFVTNGSGGGLIFGLLARVFSGPFLNGNQGYLLVFLSTIMVIVSAVVRTLSVYFQTRFVQSQRHLISLRMLKSYIHAPLSATEKINTGSMSSKIIGEIDELMKLVVLPLTNIASGIFLALSILIYLFMVNVFATIITILCISGLYSAIYFFVQKNLKQFGVQRAKSNEKRFVLANEILTGIKTIKISGGSDLYLSKFERASKSTCHALTIGTVLSALPRYAVELVGFLAVILFLTISMLQNDTNAIGSRIPIFAAFLLGAYKIIPAFQTIYLSWSNITFSRNAVESIMTEYWKNFNSQENQVSRVSKTLIWEEVRFNNVDFCYGMGRDKILDMLDFVIRKNEKVALVGKSGSGKSTVLDLLLKLREPSGGQIEVDGVRLPDVPNWKNLVSYVPQSPFILDDTLLRNVAFGQDDEKIDLDLVWKCLRVAELGEFVNEKLSDGLQTRIGQNGASLSGGQVQRVTIARALYAEKDILVLDEATSALDKATELKIVQNLVSYSNLTLLVSTHNTDIANTFSRVIDLNRS